MLIPTYFALFFYFTGTIGSEAPKVLYSVDFKLLKIKMRINLIKPQLQEITLSKARLIARLKADGSIFVAKKTNYFFKYESDNNKELKQFTNDLKEVYGLEAKSCLHRSGKNPDKLLKQVYARSKLAYEDMQKYGPFYSETWRVPNEIKKASKEVKIEFLRIFAEDEGSVIVCKGGKEIRIYSINKEGLEEVSDMLDDFGIKSEIENGFGERRNVYAVVIKGKRNIILFRNSIGFRSQRKNQKLNELISKL